MSSFNNIAVSGGGILAVAFAGCAKYIYENNLNHFHNYLGSSAGSIFCLLLILNFSLDEIHDIMLNNALTNKTLGIFSMSKLMNIFSTFGLAKGDTIVKLAESILLKKQLDKNLTFTELCKLTGKNLIITCSNINKKQIEYLSIDTYPDMKISTAIRMSTAIPILFEPVKYYNDYYVDAVIHENFSINYFENFKCDTLGIDIQYVQKKKVVIEGFSDYLFTLLKSIFNYKEQDEKNKTYPNVCTIVLDDNTSNFNVYKMKFEIDEEKYYKLVDAGYAKFKEYYDNLETDIKKNLTCKNGVLSM
jgi:predicted acylesterase/phospholipase RssA